MAHTNIPAEDPILEWRAPQHHHQDRGKTWYIIATIVAASLLIYSLFTGAWTFTALIIVITAVYWKTHKDDPLKRRMRIYKRGCALDEQFIEWVDCTGYWIFQGDGYYELNIEKKTGARIKIQTGEYDPYLLHDLLSSLLEELTDRREGVLDTIIRICKL